MSRYYKIKYSTEPKYRKYVKDYEFLSFAKKKKMEINMVKKIMDIGTKTGIDAA